MPTTLTNGIQLPDKGSVDWYSSMQSNYNLIDTHLGDTDTHVTAEDKANWNSKQGSLSQAQLDAIAQVATNTSDIATLQSGKADASHTHSSSDITDIGDYATKDYVDNSISDLVDNAPDALNTLNELSAALNDDSNFATTVTNALANKANSADLATVATSGDYNDLDNLPTIPTKTSDLSNDSDFVVSSNLATVATSGDYDDLSNKPSIPTNTSDLNNDSGFVTLNDFDIPAKTSDLTNDSGFITSSDVPTGTSDLINDSNFVDTSNPAVASGITSAKVTDYDTHIADTDIHVTSSDKTSWNTVTSKANDADVVHKSGDETVGGIKSFSDDTFIKSLNLTNEVASPSSSSSVVMPLVTTVTYTDQTASKVARVNLRITASGDKSLYPHENNQYALGLTLRKWSEVHATTYYYGSSDTEFSDKFVTTDTAQTISSEKQFTSTLKVNRLIWFNNPSVVKGTLPSTDINPYRMYFGNGLGYENSLFNIDTQVRSNGVQRFTLRCAENVVGGNDTRFIIVYNPNDAKPKYFYFMGDAKPYSNNTYGLGDSNLKWSTINGLEPSALGMPDLSNGIDISSYIPALDSGNTQGSYTPSVNGFIVFRGVASTGGCSIVQGNMGNNASYVTDPQTSNKVVNNFLPVIKDNPVVITVKGLTSIEFIYFYPCQGNV